MVYYCQVENITGYIPYGTFCINTYSIPEMSEHILRELSQLYSVKKKYINLWRERNYLEWYYEIDNTDVEGRVLAFDNVDDAVHHACQYDIEYDY